MSCLSLPVTRPIIVTGNGEQTFSFPVTKFGNITESKMRDYRKRFSSHLHLSKLVIVLTKAAPAFLTRGLMRIFMQIVTPA